jgi:hypothetical protein
MKSVRSVVMAQLAVPPQISLGELAKSAGLTPPVSVAKLLDGLQAPLHFHADIVTPAGTALGGTADVTLYSDGRATFDVHMHDSGADPYRFLVRCAVQASNGTTVLFQTRGHTDGTLSNPLGHVNRDFDHQEESVNPLILQNWLDLRGATMSASKSYEDAGALHGIEEVAKDLLGFLVADVTFGAGLALVICASAELSDALDASFVGPGGLVGVAVAGGVVWTFGPSAIIAAVVAGVAAGAITDAMVDHRQLTEEEYTVATVVFGDTLPARDRIYVTNLSHDGGRKYTWPNVDHSVLLNLGDAFADPLNHFDDAYPTRGQVFIHEMTHAWQIRAKSFVPGLICDRLFKSNAYTLEVGSDWAGMGLEQQAKIVDDWFKRLAKDWKDVDDLANRLRSQVAIQDPSFFYIANHIRLGLN